MTSRNKCRATMILLGWLIALCAAGCGQILSPLMTDDPYTSGTWIGTLVIVPVIDHDGRKYDAAALNIESGPRVIRGRPDVDTLVKPGDPPPLLCRPGVAIVDPRELGIPSGKKIKVDGRMMLAGALQFTQIERSGGGTAKGISLGQSWQPDSELVIRLDGNPKVLKE